jgi:hypothetical protein
MAAAIPVVVILAEAIPAVAAVGTLAVAAVGTLAVAAVGTLAVAGNHQSMTKQKATQTGWPFASSFIM